MIYIQFILNRKVNMFSNMHEAPHWRPLGVSYNSQWLFCSCWIKTWSRNKITSRSWCNFFYVQVLPRAKLQRRRTKRELYWRMHFRPNFAGQIVTGDEIFHEPNEGRHLFILNLYKCLALCKEDTVGCSVSLETFSKAELLFTRTGMANPRLAGHKWLFPWVSCGSCYHIDMCVSYICLLHSKSMRYFRVRWRYGGDCHMPHEFDMALCGITIENAALSLSIVGHPYTRR